MPAKIEGQILASTELDSQGEQVDKAYLEELAAKLPPRMPINQQHDMSNPTTGYVENFRVEAHGDGWALKGDVTFEGAPPVEGGFSYSFTDLIYRQTGSVFDLYIPYPHYRDDGLLRELGAIRCQPSVGKWIKKSADPSDVALIVTTVGPLLLAPAWNKIYDSLIHPNLAVLASKLKEVVTRRKGVSLRVDFFQAVKCKHYEDSIQLYFVPSMHLEDSITYGFVVKEAIGSAANLIDEDWLRTAKPIYRIVLVFDDHACAYKITQIIYKDASVRCP